MEGDGDPDEKHPMSIVTDVPLDSPTHRPNELRVLSIKLVYIFFICLAIALFIGSFFLAMSETLVFAILLSITILVVSVGLNTILTTHYHMDLYTILIQRCTFPHYPATCIT